MLCFAREEEGGGVGLLYCRNNDNNPRTNSVGLAAVVEDLPEGDAKAPDVALFGEVLVVERVDRQPADRQLEHANLLVESLALFAGDERGGRA